MLTCCAPGAWKLRRISTCNLPAWSQVGKATLGSLEVKWPTFAAVADDGGGEERSNEELSKTTVVKHWQGFPTLVPIFSQVVPTVVLKLLRACLAWGIRCHGAMWESCSPPGGNCAHRAVFLFTKHISALKYVVWFSNWVSSHVMTKLSHQSRITP